MTPGQLKERYKYPHMLPDENRLFRAWLQGYEEQFDSFEFDVHVGKGVPIPPALTPPYARMIPALTQKRIDVIAKTKEDIWILDVTPRASLRHLGQLLAYKQLYTEDYKPALPIQLGVITEYADPDVEHMFALNNITIFLAQREEGE